MCNRSTTTRAKFVTQGAAHNEPFGSGPTRLASRASEMRAVRAALLADRSSGDWALDGALRSVVAKLSSPGPQVLAKKIRMREEDLARLALRLSVAPLAETLAA